MTATPPTVQAMVDQAWEDVQNEFAGCLGEVPDEETRKALEDLFDETIRNAIENFGLVWEEPIKSYALRHVCMIAKAARNPKPGSTIAKDLPIVAYAIMKKAKESCKTVEERKGGTGIKIGILCPKVT